MYLDKPLIAAAAAAAISPVLYATTVSYALVNLSLLPPLPHPHPNYDVNAMRNKTPVFWLSHNLRVAIVISGGERLEKIISIFSTELYDWQVLINDASVS